MYLKQIMRLDNIKLEYQLIIVNKISGTVEKIC